jgi:hypothetical protein
MISSTASWEVAWLHQTQKSFSRGVSRPQLGQSMGAFGSGSSSSSISAPWIFASSRSASSPKTLT